MSELGQKIQVASSVNRNLSRSFLVTIILCLNLKENCLNLLSLVD